MASLVDRISIAPKPVFLMIGGLLAGAMYLSSGDATTNFDSEISRLTAELQTKTTRIQNTKTRLADKPKFVEEVALVNQTFRQALDYLPNKLDMQDLLKKIYSEARTAGVELTNFKPKETMSKDFYEEIPMDIQVSGTYAQITTFLANVSKISRIINIKNVQIGSARVIDGAPFVKLEGTLVAYRYKEGQ